MMYNIIEAKRDRRELSAAQIYSFIEGYTRGDIPDYQAAALMMAVFLNGMSRAETQYLTDALVRSGVTLDLSGVEGVTADKHSTGGVGDKTTLVLIPLLSAVGVKMAKLAGRGLGHTGGTIDKLESIPGFRTDISRDKFLSNINEVGAAIAAQTADFTPADKKLYALRDVTATVDSLPLIAASVMSKKIAAGAGIILLDVKAGSGAFMRDVRQAEALAECMVDLGGRAGRRTIAVISDMSQPLGRDVGNAREVIEAAETLKGRGDEDVRELCIRLGVEVLHATGRDREDAEQLLRQTLSSGKALKQLERIIGAQGGDASVLNDYSRLPRAAHTLDVLSAQGGYIGRVDCSGIGRAALMLGAGRVTKDSAIDLGAGIRICKKLGERVQAGEPLATLFTNNPADLGAAARLTADSMDIYDASVSKPPLIYKIIDAL